MNQLLYFLETASELQTPGQICGMIPGPVTALMGTLYNLIKIAVPLILIVYGMLDFGRAVMAGEEKEIKEKQKLFIKRLIAAIMVFFIFAIVQLVVGLITNDADNESIRACLEKLLNG